MHCFGQVYRSTSAWPSRCWPFQCCLLPDAVKQIRHLRFPLVFTHTIWELVQNLMEKLWPAYFTEASVASDVFFGFPVCCAYVLVIRKSWNVPFKRKHYKNLPNLFMPIMSPDETVTKRISCWCILNKTVSLAHRFDCSIFYSDSLLI